MNIFSERSRSFWMERKPQSYPRLDRNRNADVVVIGSGIAGLSTAYELLRRRTSSVIVVDRGPIGRGMTARTTAHLTSSCDDLFSELISVRDEAAAKLYYQSQAAAIDRIEEIVAEEKIACDFERKDGYLFADRSSNVSMLDDELEACRKIGFAGVEKLSRAPFDGLSKLPCLRFPRQGRFHPLKYLDSLADLLQREGVELFAETAVIEVEEKAGSVIVHVEGGHQISASAVVVATNGPINDRLAINAKEAPYRTYVVAGPIDDPSMEDVLYWDTAEPYHYVRLHPFGRGGPVLISGGEDHKTGQANDAEDRLARLERWTRERFPKLGEIRWRWSGQCLDPIDYVGFIGLSPGSERVYVATGDSGQGITTGAAAGMVLAELIESGTSPFAELYDPSRKPVSALKQFASENVTAVKELASHFMPGEISSEDELGPGEGALIRSGGRKLGVSRDENGKLHRVTSACTHSGCTIHWNSFEQCWDCGCHGSHFDPNGQVLNAPAVSPLRDPDEERTGERESE